MAAKQEMKTLYHCVFSLHLHLVLVTKYRRRCIDAAILARLHAIFDNLAERWGCDLLEFNGEPDHVHLLLSVNPKVAPSVLVNNFKTVSSRLIRKEFASQVHRVYRKPVFWSRSYCIVSCGGAPLSVLKQYVQGQAGVESGEH
ncbi:MAG: IS200/IS605 family transposase [Vulcanimicrobiaceae bacterium]